jgi:hypothetical protein
MAADICSRMESVSRDLNRQIEMFAAAFEFRRVMTLDKKDRPAAMAALTRWLKTQMGENAPFLKSLEFTPAAFPPFVPPPIRGRKAAMRNKAIIGEATNGIRIDFSGEPGGLGAGSPNDNRKLPLPPFPWGRFDTEIRSGNALVGKVSAQISLQQLLFHVLMRTQPRQGEIPFAIDAGGNPHATNPADLQKILALPLPRAGNKGGAQQQVATTNNWVLVTRLDSQSGLSLMIKNAFRFLKNCRSSFGYRPIETFGRQRLRLRFAFWMLHRLE